MRRIAMVALAVSMAGCSLDATGPAGSVEGDYSLTRLNGARLPFTFSNGLTLEQDDLSLYSDGTYQDVSRYSGGSTRTERGYYDENNGSILFQPNSSASSYQGSVSGRVLTEIVGGYTQTFEKR